METNYKLNSSDELTELARSLGIKSWEELTDLVRDLPYGRNENRTDFGLVLSERKGTCSSKHALLKKIADLNNVPNIKLILGIYQMNQSNTPGIGTVLTDNSFDFIPEAHCYLRIENKRVDMTSRNAELEKIKPDIIEEKEIEAEQVSEFKVKYHKRFLQNWIKENDLALEFDEVWQIREKCIEHLTR